MMPMMEMSALTPVLHRWKTIVDSPPATSVRDPTWPLYSDDDGHWHFWATHIWHSTTGYDGIVWHYFASELQGPWNTSGAAITPSAGALNVVTPSVIHDENDGQWYLFYGTIRPASSAYASR